MINDKTRSVKYIKGRNFGRNLIWWMAKKVFSEGILFGGWLKNFNLAVAGYFLPKSLLNKQINT